MKTRNYMKINLIAENMKLDGNKSNYRKHKIA